MGHSMGGLLIADAAKEVVDNGRPEDPLWPKIVGIFGESSSTNLVFLANRQRSTRHISVYILIHSNTTYHRLQHITNKPAQ
jgi:hypothetical protein